MTKLTKEQITEIISMKENGKPVVEILKQFKISKGTFYWHTSPEHREKIRTYKNLWYKKLSLERKKLIFERAKVYQRNYHKDKYANDSNFREKQKVRVKLGKEKNDILPYPKGIGYP